MTDSYTRQLLPASFKGVPFSIRAETMRDGRKIVLHEYVNSNQRFIEDLGRYPAEFTVRAFVSGQDFKARSDALRSVLNESGSGVLTLPVLGSQTVWVSGTYTINASQQSVGEISFDIPFAVGRPAAGPSLAQTDIEEVYQLGDESRRAIEELLAGYWVNPDTAANASVAEYDFLQSVADTYEEIRSQIPVETLSKIARIVQNTQLNAPSLIRNGGQLASTLIGASDVQNPGFWQNISLGLSQVASQTASTGTFTLNQGLQLLNTLQSPLSSAFGDLINLTGFGSGLALRLADIRGDYVSSGSTSSVPLWPATTQGRIDRNTNRESIVYTTRVNALIAAYEVAAANEYRTIDDVNTVRSTLEDTHEQLMRIDTSDSDLIQSNSGVRNAVENVRLASLAVIEQKRQQTFDTTTINIRAPISSFVLAHRLYAEEFTNDVDLANRGLEIRDLNPDYAATMLENETTVFRS